MASKHLEGKVAIVTGAGRGIGRGIALLLAEQGASVVVNDLGCSVDGAGQETQAADEVVREIVQAGGKATPNYDSVAEFASAGRIIETALKTYGRLDILVNVAGILRDRMIFNMDEESWDAVVAVHLKGTFNMSHHLCAYWREEHKKGNVLNGRIINTSSDAGLLGNVGQSNYGACKAAVAAMAIIIDAEMRKYGVTANAIAPLARTRLTVEATPSTAGLMGAEVKEGQFDVWGPQNVAPLVTWLASDDAADVHGEVFRVGGGTVFLLQGWHTVGKVRNNTTWDPEKLGPALKAELAKGITKKESMADILGEGL